MENSIVVELDDFDELEKHIKSFVSNISGETWEDMEKQLSQYFSWEYDDYVLVN